MIEQLKVLPDELGRVETLLADNGYFSAANVAGCEAAKIMPLIAMGRQPHYPSLDERFAAAPPAPQNPTAVQAMAHRLKTPDGKKHYAAGRRMVEPVFGIIKSAMGFRQFQLRGLDRVRGEWSLVTMAWNVKRMFALRPLDDGAKGSSYPMSSRKLPGLRQPDRKSCRPRADPPRGGLRSAPSSDELSPTSR